jgi:hypothetical protein
LGVGVADGLPDGTRAAEAFGLAAAAGLTVGRVDRELDGPRD